MKKMSAGDITLNEQLFADGAVDKVKMKGKAQGPDIKDKYEYDGWILTPILNLFKKEEEDPNAKNKKK